MRILVTGASGTLGGYLLREAHAAGHAVVAWSGTQAGERFGVPLRPIDLCDAGAAFQAARPDAILHAAAVSTVAECLRDPGRAERVNVDATARLAQLAGGTRFVHVSTDLVFDGTAAPYRETDAANPLSVYGRTKLAAEAKALAADNAAVVRISLLFGPSLGGRPTFFDGMVSALRESGPVTLFSDEWRTPLDLTTAARGLLAVAASDFRGVLHLGGAERLSRLEMGERLARQLRVAPQFVVASRLDHAPEPRPPDVSLDSSRFAKAFPHVERPTFADALAQCFGG